MSKKVVVNAVLFVVVAFCVFLLWLVSLSDRAYRVLVLILLCLNLLVVSNVSAKLKRMFVVGGEKSESK